MGDIVLGGFCPRGDMVQGDIGRGILSWGVLSGGILPLESCGMLSACLEALILPYFKLRKAVLAFLTLRH